MLVLHGGCLRPHFLSVEVARAAGEPPPSLLPHTRITFSSLLLYVLNASTTAPGKLKIILGHVFSMMARVLKLATEEEQQIWTRNIKHAVETTRRMADPNDDSSQFSKNG